MEKLKVFQKPDINFNAVEYLSDQLNIEEGEEYIMDVEESTDEEVLEWAQDNGYLDDSDYLLDNGKLDLEQLRELKYDLDVESYNENPPLYATPSGRAYGWFEDLEFSLPDGIDLVDGPYPGSDWRGVVVKDLKTLIELQMFLETNGFKVNFTIQS